MQPVTLTVSDAGKITNVDFVQWVMNEIEDTAFTRADVAKTYAILIDKGHRDFTEINKAILKRWSPAGFKWIKEQAWEQLKAA